ncbi:hypothetical protein DB346_15905 [Verrucomicrobia bacterium LW23]|nr:hypothetical protein DB346_15905 [Verrucomicrobia bacterium LW23]
MTSRPSDPAARAGAMLHISATALTLAALALAGCASPGSSEREGRAGVTTSMRQDIYVSQIEGFEYRVIVDEITLANAALEAGPNPINSADAERRCRNYMRAAFPLRQSLVVQNVIEMPLLGTERPAVGDPKKDGRPYTYFLVSMRSTHTPRFREDVDMVKLVVLPNGKIVPFTAKRQWIS